MFVGLDRAQNTEGIEMQMNNQPEETFGHGLFNKKKSFYFTPFEINQLVLSTISILLTKLK